MGLLRQAPLHVYQWVKRRFTVSITIMDKDPLFEWTKLWLDSLPYASVARNVSCSLYREADTEFSSDSRVVFAPACGNHFFRHAGRWIWLERSSGDVKTDKPPMASSGNQHTPETITITVLGTRQTSIRDIVKEIALFAADDERRKVRAYTSANGWWRRLPTFQPRQIATVDLPTEDERRIVVAIEQFLAARAMYTKRGIPYHLNFLFAGLPGTGKTSIASALCGHFGLSLHLLNIAGPNMNDERLVELILSLPRRSMILMEDVDAVVPERAARPRTVAVPTDDGASASAAQQGVTLSGLLNCMDGLTAPDGAVIVMTTNRPEFLDSALLRPGRIDMRVDFGPATREQIERMCRRLAPNRILNGAADVMLAAQYTTAQVQAELLS